MPKNASPAKVAATRGYGATVVLEGKNYDESWIKAQEIAKTTGSTIIHAFDDSQIIAAPVSYTHLTLPTKRIV